jgi:hypothetical protein
VLRVYSLRSSTLAPARVGLSAPVLLGCTRSTSASIPHAKSLKVESLKVESLKVESLKVESLKVESLKVESLSSLLKSKVYQVENIL